ncbi:MAG: XRE family transcriptional regulator [Gemella haemolysans]|nr:XRE family transcriptional regulator [Gemella haemolysans]
MEKTIGTRIKELRTKLNLSADDLAHLIGKNRSTIYRYENSNIEKLPVSILEPLAIALQTTPAYIMGISQDTTTNSLSEKINTTVQQLNEENQNKTYKYAKNLLQFQNRTVQEVSIKYKPKELTEIFVTEKVAAGVGYSYGNNEVTPYYTDREDLMPYDMATCVFGDSMEPEFSDGDIILLKQGYDNVNGDIYVVDYDGKSYVKKLYNDGSRFVLKSLNKKYSDIIIYRSDLEGGDIYFNIIGKVVDSFTPVDK